MVSFAHSGYLWRMVDPFGLVAQTVNPFRHGFAVSGRSAAGIWRLGTLSPTRGLRH